MNVIFCGSYPFSLRHLQALAADHRTRLLAVVTRPDIPDPQPCDCAQTPVAAWCRANGHADRLYQPASLKSEEAAAHLAPLSADVLVCVAYSQRIPMAIVNALPLGGVNVHPSLLPRWRGPDPVRRAILAEDERVGCSIHALVHAFDAGVLFWQQSIHLAPQADAGDVLDQLAALSAPALPALLQGIKAGSVEPGPQVGEATYATAISEDEQWIRPSDTVRHATLLLRALAPYRCARWIDGNRIFEVTLARRASVHAQWHRLALADGAINCVVQRVHAHSEAPAPGPHRP